MDIYNNSKCFSFLTETDKVELEKNKTHVSFLNGETIFKQEVLNPNIFFVISGYVKIYLEVGKFKRINICIAQSGDFFIVGLIQHR